MREEARATYAHTGHGGQLQSKLSQHLETTFMTGKWSYCGRNLTGKGYGLGLFFKINLMHLKYDLTITFRHNSQGHIYYKEKKKLRTISEKAT